MTIEKWIAKTELVKTELVNEHKEFLAFVRNNPELVFPERVIESVNEKYSDSFWHLDFIRVAKEEKEYFAMQAEEDFTNAYRREACIRWEACIRESYASELLNMVAYREYLWETQFLSYENESEFSELAEQLWEQIAEKWDLYWEDRLEAMRRLGLSRIDYHYLSRHLLLTDNELNSVSPRSSLIEFLLDEDNYFGEDHYLAGRLKTERMPLLVRMLHDMGFEDLLSEKNHYVDPDQDQPYSLYELYLSDLVS